MLAHYCKKYEIYAISGKVTHLQRQMSVGCTMIEHGGEARSRRLYELAAV